MKAQPEHASHSSLSSEQIGESAEGTSMAPPAFQLQASGNNPPAENPNDDQSQDHAAFSQALPMQAKMGGSSEAVQLKAGAVVQRQLEQPIEAQAPASAIGIAEFIALVEREETRAGDAVLNPDGSFNTGLMITRLRQIFYGSDGWNELLVPGTDTVDSGYEHRERERSRTEVELVGPNFDMVDTETYPVDENGNIPEIYTRQEIALPDGTYLDIGHVFAGLDAFNHPTDVSAPVLSSISVENGGATTWVGDLGSVLAEALIHRQNDDGNQPSEAVLQDKINVYASPQDMLGNIDAYAIADSYDTGSSSGQRVSEILRHYYLGEGVEANQSRRYTIFANSIGLTGWNGSAWTNEAAMVTHYTDQVNDAAALYFGAGADKNLFNLPGVAGVITGSATNESARMFVELFFDALRTRVAAE